MIEQLKEKFGVNEPIFTSEILDEMYEYSRPRVFQLLKKAQEEGELIRFDSGVYYLPTLTRYGDSKISVEQVVRKKYITNEEDVFGIYGGLLLKESFLLTAQIANTIEIITNKETMSVREITIKGRKIILRKSRALITKENANVYIILELFNSIDIKEYQKNDLAQKEVKKFIKDKSINLKDIFKLSSVFPSKAIRNIMESGIIDEFI